MTLAQKIIQTQTQSLTMTPQLQQAIKMLQMSSQDLTSYLQEEQLSNPLLDVEPPQTWPSQPEVFCARQSFPQTGESDFDPLARLPNHPQTLRAFLLEQLSLELHTPQDRLIGHALIDALDPNGYLADSLENIASTLGCPLKKVERILGQLETLEPAGVFAKNLGDCLKKQLKSRNELSPSLETLCENLELLPILPRKKLLQKLDLSETIFEAALKKIQSLNPKPGIAFEPETTRYAIPDLKVTRREEGEWTVRVNDRALPKIAIDQSYRSTLGNVSHTAQQFLKAKGQEAQWILNAIAQRRQTIFKVAQEIVARQQAFMSRGVLELKPLILRDIAEAIGMHESTISRVTQNKYIETPFGIFELKYFFTSALKKQNQSEACSSETLRHLLKKFIHAENPASPLSDDQLVHKFYEAGYKIARRTITKYRKMMKVPSSFERRRKLG